MRSCCIPRRLLVVWMSAQQNIYTAEADRSMGRDSRGQIFRSFYVWRKVLADVDRGAKPSVGVPGRKRKWLFFEAFGYSHLLDELHLKISLRGFGKVLAEAKGFYEGFGWITWPVRWFKLRKSTLEKIGKILTLQAAENGVGLHQIIHKNQSDIPGNLGQNGWLWMMVGMCG